MSASINNDEINDFAVTKMIPGGSWGAWLTTCYMVVEKRHRFNCTWGYLVGVTVGMILSSPESRRDFIRTVRNQCHRTEEHRFYVHFVALAHALCGATAEELSATYGGRGQKMRKSAPTLPYSILDWPLNGMSTILPRLYQQQACPLIGGRNSDTDFFITLLLGYFVVTHDDRAASRLLEHEHLLTDDQKQLFQ